ncbi:MAG: sigma-54 dependent transcriptional regulator [Nitrospirota bacterium]
MESLKTKILVVDDDPDIRKILQDRLEALRYLVVTAENGRKALEKLPQEEPDLMFLDLQMPGMDGIEVLRKLKDHADLPIIIITAFGTIEKAVEAMKEGAFDFITKPFSPDHLEIVIKKALERTALKEENRYLQGAVNSTFPEIVGTSPRLKAAIQVAQQVAATSSTVLLLGESGTGKEIFARWIHRWSPRAKRPFVVVNCVALRDELLESELFGHEKGAFTGAHQMKQGKLEIANGGTVFLDEIGDFKPDLQAKLLRVIQEREFERVGGTRRISVDIRIIAATNRDLQEEVQEGRFREDLFFRLNVVTISLPPLREKKEDIPLLADFFLRRACHSVKKPLMKISAEAVEHLMRYHWPGNVRELGNLIERAVVLARGAEITPEDLPLLRAPTSSDESFLSKPYHDAVRQAQRDVIRHALQSSGGNQAKAAELLGLQRTYLARLIKKLQVR